MLHDRSAFGKERGPDNDEETRADGRKVNRNFDGDDEPSRETKRVRRRVRGA